MSVANVANQLFESFQNAPHIENIPEDIGTLVVAGLIMYGEKLKFNKTTDQYAYRHNSQALLASTVKSTKESTKYNQLKRLNPSKWEWAGIGLVAASLVGNPIYDASLPNNEANTVVVEDNSYSMGLTTDLGVPGLSRDEAANNAIDSSNYEGWLGVIQVAQNNYTVTNLTRNWRSQEGQFNTLAVNPNGGSLTPALENAESLLPARPHVKHGHEGSIVLISDGTVDDTVGELTNEANTLKKDGVKVKVVVPGTANSSYTLHGTNTASGVEPYMFAGFGSASNVTQPETAAEVTADVHADLQESGNVNHQYPWLITYAVGFIAFGYGFFRDKWQRADKFV